MRTTREKRSCIFCGHEGKPTAEHVWPAWIDTYIPKIPGGEAGYKRKPGYKHKHGTSDGRFEALFEYERLDHRAKVVCLSCNNGWMNDLENAARPFLKDMISGGGVVLEADAQRTVATWAAKTAMCVERTFPSATQAIPISYYKSLFADPSEPPASITVSAGCYLGDTPYGISHRSWPLWQFVKRQPSSMFQSTFRIGHLILQLLGAEPTDDFELINDRSENLIQLWPTLVQSAEWPPKFVFGDDAFERFSSVHFSTEDEQTGRR